MHRKNAYTQNQIKLKFLFNSNTIIKKKIEQQTPCKSGNEAEAIIII